MMLVMVEIKEDLLLLTHCQLGQLLELFGLSGSPTSDMVDIVMLAHCEESDGTVVLGGLLPGAFPIAFNTRIKSLY